MWNGAGHHSVPNVADLLPDVSYQESAEARPRAFITLSGIEDHNRSSLDLSSEESERGRLVLYTEL